MCAKRRGPAWTSLSLKQRERDFCEFAFGDDELSSLPQGSREAWIHRGWCAKEAAVKAFRLGFAELPQFRILAVQEKTGGVELECKPRGIRVTATTWIDQNRVIAVVIPRSYKGFSEEQATNRPT